MPRPSGRSADALRDFRFLRGFVGSALGSCLIETGRTRVLCTVMAEPNVPPCGKPEKLGVCEATPTLAGAVVQQWMCAAVTLPLRPANVVCTRMVNRSRSSVTTAAPLPSDALDGFSFAPLSVVA